MTKFQMTKTKKKPTFQVLFALNFEHFVCVCVWGRVSTFDKRQKKCQMLRRDPVYDIMPEEVDWMWKDQRYQLRIGEKLYCFLDGDKGCLQQALKEAGAKGELLHIFLATCNQTANWPFELLAKDGLFLLSKRLHLVRGVPDSKAKEATPPENRPLKLLFMACSALDVQPELDFEKEEESIFKVTEKLAVDMEVEDSGSLEGLKEQLEQAQYDVVHLSGHASINEEGVPFFIMEDETGYRWDVFPDELWQKALVENPPRLLFLSGCRTGETPKLEKNEEKEETEENRAAFSFAHVIAEKYHVPAVLGWGRSVSDVQATLAEQMIYHELSRGRGILEAVQQARNELIDHFESSPSPAWPLLRLFSSGEALDAIVKTGQKVKAKPRRMKHVYLEQSQVKVLIEGFVGRRRQLQQSLRAIKQDYNKVGVLLHGTGGLGKSCLAGKISERFKDHTLIIVHGRLDAITLEAALMDAFIKAGDKKGKGILAEKKELTEKLPGLCAGSFKEKNYLVLLDDFEQNLEGAEEGQPGAIVPEAVELVRVLLHCLPFSEKQTQVIFTSRYLFSLTEQDRDLVTERLGLVSLTSFREPEQLKKARELKHILDYPEVSLIPRMLAAGRGNPRLMEWIDVLIGEMEEAEVSKLLVAISDKQEEFIQKHVIRELLLRGGEKLARLLQWFSIYRRPVLQEGVQGIGDKVGLDGWQELLEQGKRLSLVEHDQARKSFELTPLLREELFKDLEEDALQSCHEAAFYYYKNSCEGKDEDQFDPIGVEEWIYHALGCGEEEVASRQGGNLVGHLRDHLAYRESRRVGLWVLEEKKAKKQELSTAHDAFLLNELALTTYNMGEHQTAIEYYKHALDILKGVHGEKHQDTATTLNNLGAAWLDLGEHQKAIKYFQQALSISKAAFGDKHPDIARTLGNLGLALKELGDHRKAIEYYKQALDIDRALFGEEHPRVATRLNNLGLAWSALGEIRKALEYYQQALDIDRALFGEKHPDVARDLNNLGAAYFELGKKKTAKGYFEQAYAIWMEFFGENHPYVKSVAGWLKDCE
jgi:tetratricopeptide (TPR) repeat protein